VATGCLQLGKGGGHTPAMASPHPQRSPSVVAPAVFAMVLNSALLGALCVLAFDPQRRAFGRATGLWHDCAVGLGGGTGYERWSPVLLLLLLLPVTLGVIFAARTTKPLATWLLAVSLALGVVAVLLVVVPTGACIA
jgi:hypothetical protein